MRNLIYIIGCAIAAFLMSCGEDIPEYYPKPRGYMRLDFPEPVYSVYQDSCPYTFEIPEYFKVVPKEISCYKGIEIDRFNAELYLLYNTVDTNLVWHIERARKMAYEHSIKADAIEEAVIKNESNKVYGMKYRLIGNAATNYQFYVTDSINHFVRAELYFNAAPNYDSLKPSLDYVVKDIERMIETFSWK